MSATSPAGHTPYYFIPTPSAYPVLVACGMFMLIFGGAHWVNGDGWGGYFVLAGLIVWLSVLFRWFRQAVGESEGGLYSQHVDLSFRWSMSWFIFSEVMFFAAFFGALFYVRNISVPDLGSALTGRLLWPEYASQWPTVGPYIKQQFSPMGAIGIPLLNTIILLTSGGTLTIAHHALKAGHRGPLKFWLFVTIALGFTFLGFQAYEYTHAYSELNLKLSTGVYGSTFFMLTGFHGAHVTIGAIMLSVTLFRAFRGHFDAEHHFGFEAAAWYWHFVDVVWLLLFVLVYWL